MSRPPREPGWYWARASEGGHWEVLLLRGGRARTNYGEWWDPEHTHEWGPRILPPTEPPAPSLEDDVRALLREIEAEAARVLNKQRAHRGDSPYDNGRVDGLSWAAALLRARLGAGGGTP